MFSTKRCTTAAAAQPHAVPDRGSGSATTSSWTCRGTSLQTIRCSVWCKTRCSPWVGMGRGEGRSPCSTMQFAMGGGTIDCPNSQIGGPVQSRTRTRGWFWAAQMVHFCSDPFQCTVYCMYVTVVHTVEGSTEYAMLNLFLAMQPFIN